MGTMIVDVREKGFGGDVVTMRIPGLLVPVAMTFIPDQVFVDCGDDDDDMRYAAPFLKIVREELETMPDVELVHVETPTEIVVIEKRGKDIIIDVETPGESVHLVVPVKAAAAVSKKMERVFRNSAEKRIYLDSRPIS
jgi:hypothetical protein